MYHANDKRYEQLHFEARELAEIDRYALDGDLNLWVTSNWAISSRA